MAQSKGKKMQSSAVVPVQHAREPAHAQPWPGLACARDFDRMFEDFERRFRWPRLWGPESRETAAAISVRIPVVDVYEQDNEVVVKAEIPGLSKEDVQVNLSDSTLTITAEKQKEEEVKDRAYYHCERSFGSFSRRLELPAKVKTEEAKASIKDGLLEIHLPKAEEAKRMLVKVEQG